MEASERFRQLLIADIALVKGVASARDVACALQGFWERGGTSDSSVVRELEKLGGIDTAALTAVVEEADGLVAQAGGDPRLALTLRGGLDRSVHLALGQEGARLTRALSVMGVTIRAPLRSLPPDRYVDFEAAGVGGMGVVYAALDTEMNRRVAFKMVRPQTAPSSAGAPPSSPLEAARPEKDTPEGEAFEELKARLVQEAWVTGGLEHPGIVPVYEIGQTPSGIPYYTMRYVRGDQTLADAIAQKHGAPFEERLSLLEPFLKICDALNYVHDKGVVHRDLKPANVALGQYGEVVVLDWGLARLEGREDVASSSWRARVEEMRTDAAFHTLEGGAMGTAGYMAPEAAHGRLAEVDPRSDVYSLGVMLYEILTGRLPYEFRSYAEYATLLLEKDPLEARAVDSRVPEALSDLCARALARTRGVRPGSADEVAETIRAWQTESAVEREVDGLLRDARAALASAASLQGEPRLAQADRAAALLAQVEGKRPGARSLAELRSRTVALREEGIRERERASADLAAARTRDRERRLRTRILVGATCLALLLAAAAVWQWRSASANAASARLAQGRTAHYAELVSDRSRLARAVLAAETLFPRDNASVEDAHRYLTDAKSALLHLDDRVAERRSLEAVGKRDLQEEARLRSLQDTIKDGRLLQDGALARLERRFMPSADWQEAASWERTIAEIRDPEKNPIYGGLTLPGPQFGLVPLGRDPHSHLFEFAHVYSGAVPTRSAETGQLVQTPDMAIVFVLIPGGTALLGGESESGKPGYDDMAYSNEGPIHEVILSPFFISKYECTQAQWGRLADGELPSIFPRRSEVDARLYPVEEISWADCEGNPGWLSRYGLSLPTEAQWEYACRGALDPRGSVRSVHLRWPELVDGTGHVEPIMDEKALDRAAWTLSNSGGQTHQVGLLRPNRFGLHDMLGNVREWCHDQSDGTYYQVLAEGSEGERTDPMGPAAGWRGQRVYRGGSWYGVPRNARASWRVADVVKSCYWNLGVRPARVITK